MSPSTPVVQPRRGARAAWLALALAGYMAVFGNLGVWREAADLIGPQPGGVLAAAVVAVAFLLHVLLQLVAWPWVFKPVAVCLLLLTAVSSYFVDALGVRIDDTMMRNVLETDTREAAELITAPLLWRVAWCGLLPSLILLRLRPRYARLPRELGLRLALLLTHLGLLGGAYAAWGGELTLFAREHRPMRWMLSPSAPLVATTVLISKALKAPSGPLREVGADARARAFTSADPRRRVVVFVLGETASASHFALNGYERDTNPGLALRDVINFTDVHSCGTSTAESLPCLFSLQPREQFSRGQSDGQQNLLDVLQRCGVQVLWRDNNSGCKGVCDRVPFEWAASLSDDPALRSEGGVYDAALLAGLGEAVAQRDGDVFIVLHQEGSHGPAYAKRSPPAAKRFLPECDRADVQNCPREELINAYDNTILYTDQVLCELIDLLEPLAADANVAMVYVSDHGESLGENGVYLHGFPYWLAPEEQTHVPMLMWLGPGSAEGLGLDRRLLEAGRHRPLSHDHVFHTVLGLFGIESLVYEGELDLLAPSRDV